MRIVVISDSHGNETAIRTVLKAEPQATAVIHLGDGAAEAERLKAEFPALEWHIVRGNCDVGTTAPVNDCISVGGHRVYLTHGHGERVKSGLLTLCYTAREREVEIALYGHTHVPSIDFQSGVMLMNPGSVGYQGSYGILEIRSRDVIPSLCRSGT